MDQPRTVQDEIESLLTGELDCHYLEVVNESHRHSVPPGSESHFKVVLVSSEFDGQMLIERHRRVNGVLSELLAGPIHALALHTFTPGEWERKQREFPPSPECLGGSRKGASG